MLGLTFSFVSQRRRLLRFLHNPLREWEYNGISRSKNPRFVAANTVLFSVVFNLTHAQQTTSRRLISDSVLKS